MPESETKRLFVALFPTAEIVAALQAAIADLAAGIPPRAIRWTRPDQIHLTLFFLGAIATARLPQIQSAVDAACRGHRPHDVRGAGLGCFPNPSRPRILWAGLGGDLAPLEGLKKSIDTNLIACGCVGEDRPFHPHLTLGRAGDLRPPARRRLVAALHQWRARDFGPWQIGQVDLMESRPSPRGSVYATLHSTPLAG